MKTRPLVVAAASILLLSSCVDPYYAGGIPPQEVGPPIIGREPVVVERTRYIDERPPVMVERYSEPHRETRPYYGDPVPGTTYQRTTTRTYQGY